MANYFAFFNGLFYSYAFYFIDLLIVCMPTLFISAFWYLFHTELLKYVLPMSQSCTLASQLCQRVPHFIVLCDDDYFVKYINLAYL